ncbi:MAG: methyltransferase domain-containing protein [Acidimicrobiia bacterium]|nr:methyltransferase domain-containing protein [Acidimicrobiia bacterium]
MPSSTPSSSLFDRWSATYDLPGLQRFTYRPIHDAIVAQLAEAHPSTVVDLGCGTGQLTRRLIERFPDAAVIGVDFSAGMLAEATGRLGPNPADHPALVQAEAERLPFGPSSVDVVVCTESFHWYRDQAEALDGLAEIVRPGGRVLVASIATMTGLGDDIVRRLTSRGGRPIRALPPERLRRLLDRAGFEVVDQRRVPRLGLIGWPVLTDARHP